MRVQPPGMFLSLPSFQYSLTSRPSEVRLSAALRYARVLYPVRSQIALLSERESAICDRGYYINDLALDLEQVGDLGKGVGQFLVVHHDHPFACLNYSHGRLPR
jgi:hypothetical protein